MTKDDGQLMSLLVRAEGTDRARIEMTGQPRNRWQLGSDGTREDIAEALFDQIDATLAGVV